MKKLLLLALAAALLPAAASAQTGSTRANLEWKAALTDASRFGAPRYATASLPACGASNKGAIAFDATLGSLTVCNGTGWGFYAGATTITGVTTISGATTFTGSATFSSAANFNAATTFTGANTFTGGVTLTPLSTPIAPTTVALAGLGAGNLSVGVYSYKTTLVNASGETAASAASDNVTVVQPTAVADPVAALTAAEGIAGNVPAGSYLYKVTFTNSTGETAPGPASVAVVVDPDPVQIDLTAIPTGGAGVDGRKVYRSEDAGATYKLAVTIANNVATTATDNTADISAQADIPSANTASDGRAAVSGIPVGATGTTARKLYRTQADGSTYNLLATIADNTTTTYADNVADATIVAAAEAPTTNTTADLTVSGSIDAAGGLTSTATGSLGWSVLSAANQACTTTCTSAAVFGFDAATTTIVDTASALADVCVCAGSN